MASPIKLAILANGTQAKKELDSVASKTASIGKQFAGIGRKIAAGAGVVGVAAGGFAVAAVKIASDAEQSLGATEQIFGKYADAVVKNSNKAANAVGLSSNQYRESSNLMGSLFKNQGVAMDQLSTKTDEHIKLGADLSAMFGGSVPEAIDAMTAAYKGEFNQLERYGVTLNQSMINTEADTIAKKKYGKALKDLGPEQERQAKQLATQELLFKQTGDAQGTFAKESTTLAGILQRLGAHWENIKIKIGTLLLPVLSRLAGFVNEKVIPAVEKFGKQMQSRLTPYVEKLTEAAKGLVERLKPVGEWFMQHPEVVKGIGIALGIAAGAAVVLAAAMGAVALVASPITLVIVGIAALGAGIAYAYKHSETFRNTVNALGQNLLELGQTVLPILQGAWQTFGGTILSFVTNTFKNIWTVIKGALKIVQGIVKTVLSAIRGDWKGAWDGIKTILSGALSVIKGVFSQGWNVLKSITSLAWNALKTIVSSGVGKMMDVVRGIPGKVKSALSNAKEWLKETGKDIIRGLGAGLDSMWDWVQSKISKLTDKIPGWVKKRLGIKSPSRVMRKLARWIPVGIAKGIGDGEKGVQKALDKITKRIEKSIKGKNEKKREKRVLKSLKDEYKALRKNAKAHDRITKRIKEARAALAAAKKAAADYAANVKSGIMSFGSLTAVDTGHMNSPTALVDQMSARLDQAKRFSDLITQLTGKLNETSLKELIDKGVEGGLAAAEALVAGGPRTIAEVNKLTAELDAVGTKLGKHGANQFHQAGIDSAQGLVNGLLKDQKKLEKAAKRLAKKLVKALKKELKIKSPSGVFREIGAFTTDGLTIGLDEKKVERAGKILAKDLVSGFGRPRLDATTAWDSQRRHNNQPLEFRVHLTADQISQVQRGKQISADISAYKRAGGAA